MSGVGVGLDLGGLVGWKETQMAKQETASQRARMVLAIFDKFERRAGEHLVLGNLVVVGAKNGLSALDVDVGLEIGCKSGWFDIRPDHKIYLTDSGYEAMNVAA